MMREASIVQIERILGSTEDSHIKNTTRELSDQPCIPHIDPVTFQADYIDIIPEQWTVVSLSVSEERDELRLSRLRSGHAPFILSIPLNRHISRDCDEEIFGFDEGKAELLDIIGLANFSTHEKRDFSKKGAKSEWWEARGALDARLKDLLVNIENIWFGGFRGILAQDIPTQELLSRFQQSFYKILGKHLPSRRKMGKAAKLEPVTLDSRVLELFTGLGMPQNIVDLDEPLMDLLYFVVDILQFHGERNAYDEIDFDHMVIETREALAHYHKAAHDEAVSSYPRHTILIIDKALHAFPWESMPCMVGQAVSRVPSLSCLRDRIVHQQKQPQQSIYDSETPGFKASASDGAYILNPAGDLVSTESSLLPHLSQLTSWTPIINKEPTESEISSQLSSRSIYLYFGHGSGGQYIRSCTVKKLESCAVALLMGCSSGAMTEAGEYESYGTPISYMHAGAPAVVGTLWDVTDKDIDRFSVRALQRWGLFLESPENKGKRSESPTKRSMKGKGKGRAKVKEYVESEVTAGNVSLDKAVAEARESCILRYLNGAAPVVYGVPVYLA